MKKYLGFTLLVCLLATSGVYARHHRKESKSRFSFNLFLGEGFRQERRAPVVYIERYAPERVIVIDRRSRYHRERDSVVVIQERDPYDYLFGY